MSKKKWLLAIILVAVALYFLGPYVPYIGSYLGLFRHYVDLGLVFVGGIFAGGFATYPVQTVTGTATLGVAIIGAFKKWYSDAKAKISGLTQKVRETATDANTLLGEQQTTIEAKDIQISSLETKLTAALDSNKQIAALTTEAQTWKQKYEDKVRDYNSYVTNFNMGIQVPKQPTRVN